MGRLQLKTEFIKDEFNPGYETLYFSLKALLFVDINNHNLLYKIILFNNISDVNAAKYRDLCMSFGYGLVITSSIIFFAVYLFDND